MAVQNGLSVAKKFNDTMRNIIASKSSDIAQMLGSKEKAEKFKGDLLLLGTNPQIVKYKPGSVFTVAIQAAASGLSILPQHKEAYIVPYGTEAQLQIGYVGWLKIARMAGYTVKAFLVFDVDEFKYYYQDGDVKIKWQPNFTERVSSDSKWVEEHLKGVLVAVKDNQGNLSETFVQEDTLRKIKIQNRAVANKKFSPWSDWAAEMYTANAIKYVVGKLPMTDRIANAVALDSSYEVKDDTPEHSKFEGRDLAEDGAFGFLDDVVEGETVEAGELEAKVEQQAS
jgi:phage RecT family recombinase